MFAVIGGYTLFDLTIKNGIQASKEDSVTVNEKVDESL